MVDIEVGPYNKDPPPHHPLVLPPLTSMKPSQIPYVNLKKYLTGISLLHLCMDDTIHHPTQLSHTQGGGGTRGGGATGSDSPS